MEEENSKDSIPRWYQDLSIPQMENVLSLGTIIRADYVERVTGRTQRALNDIGITSTFVKITPAQIRQLRRLTDLDPVKFLCEIYRIVTGQYFTDEEYKSFYDCNERIILSAIAFLTLPEVIVELHNKLPMPPAPKLPPKPTPPEIPHRKRSKFPYLDPEFTKPPDWLRYTKALWLWRQKCEKIPIPRVILPPNDDYYRSDTRRVSKGDKLEERLDEEPHEPYQVEGPDDKDFGREILDKPFAERLDELSENEAESRQIQESDTPSKRATEMDDKIGEDKLLRTGSEYDPEEGTKSDAQLRRKSSILPRKSTKFDNSEETREGSRKQSRHQSSPSSRKSTRFDNSEETHEGSRKKSRPASFNRKSTKFDIPEETGEDSGKKSRLSTSPRKSTKFDDSEENREDSRKKSKLSSSAPRKSTKFDDSEENREDSRKKSKLSASAPRKSTKIGDSEDTREDSRKKSRPGSVSHKKSKKYEDSEETLEGSQKKSRPSSASHRKPKNQGESEEKLRRFKDRRKSRRTIPRKKSESEVAKNRFEDQECKNVLPLPHFEEKLCDDKEKHLIVSGISKNDIPNTENSFNFPVSIETSGIACVTPANSDESFFKALNLERPKKSYPRGRENLSMRWQEWFHNVDEEFVKMEKEANKILDSVEKTMKLINPEMVCDACCSCRQTRKADEKYRKTKGPRTVVESVTIDGGRNRIMVGSVAMSSLGPSPSGSLSDIPMYIESYDNIVKSKIISGVANEKGEMNYFISGVSKDRERIPRRKIVPLETEAAKNVPPCGCAIEKMMNEGLSEITSDDDIPWSRDQTCIGKKYRPGEVGASSCRDYPRDTSCGRNPFKRKIDEKIRAKIRDRNCRKDDYPREKNMYSLADFPPCGDEDGMAVCGGPWGAINIPDEDELARRAAEEKFILESPPCGDKPGRSICGAAFGARHPIPKKPKKDEDDDEDEEDEDEPKEKTRHVREHRQRLEDFKLSKQLNRDQRCSAANEKSDFADDYSPEEKNRERSGRDGKRKLSEEKRSRSKFRSKSQTSNEISDEDTDNKKRKGKHKDSKERKRRSRENEEIIKNWKSMKRIATKLIDSSIKFPEDSPGKCQREESRPSCCGGRKMSTALSRNDYGQSASRDEGPFHWKTESEDALPTEKTLVYLADPDDPVKRVPVRPGGKPCLCRENRNTKKKLLYNISSLTTGEQTKRGDKFSRVIDGLLYVTPIPSVRNSEEYIPEYELSESPYEKCTRERKMDDSKYIEKYLGPPSLIKKQRETISCSGMREKMELKPKVEEHEKIGENEVTKETEKEPETEETKKEKKLEKKLNKFEDEKWLKACENEDLREFYSRCRDNVPCWLRCVEFSKDGCCLAPRRLRVVRPVCECKYEKKIVKRDEERKSWINRQEKLKSHKKQPYTQFDGFSKPVESETKLVISGVTENPQKQKQDEDSKYHVSGVSKNQILLSGDNILTGIGMHTPITTPEVSKQKLPVAKEHRHWSLTGIPGTQVVSDNNGTVLLGQAPESNWKEKISASKDSRIDVLFTNSETLENDRRVEKIDQQDEKSEHKGGYREKIKEDHPGKEAKVSPQKERKSSTPKREREDSVNKKRKSSVPKSDKKDSVEKPRKSSVQNKEKDETRNDRKSSVENKIKDETRNDRKSSVENKVKDETRNDRKSSVRDDSKHEIPKHEQKNGDEEIPTNSEGASERDREENGVTDENRRKTENEANKVGSDSPAIHIQDHKSQELGEMNPQESTRETVQIQKADGVHLGGENGPVHRGTVAESSGKINLKEMMKAELKNLEQRGFLFAKLPACYKMPQLQWWIMYRKGIALPKEVKKTMMDRSMEIFKTMEKGKPKKMKAPDLGFLKEDQTNLNWNHADEIKQQIALKKSEFYSNLRKSRVLHTRAMWGLMEFGKFPGVGFKRAFFIYQANKESDGFTYKPWQNSENEQEKK